ncbi:family 16 glycosylhydrolase [Flammeovirga kamogawensis]|uniref:Family 16 glycosylhydrolase n=1 Tax=Flammeovirga kamogawensis TaxID=373891 RepID=A0ABX8H4H9_9BACT|nr:family 16 glycosylhydrolase [Flammeovirga kamogawensis]MBB6460258.1 beta-glucanase (GH16 family) [Flammeovirga kamogawensis]QWG10070.1 family 16 glycosylhydrolase [Flammeovirga kamogawensis]TRX65577.1 family 16 glycosylhydrolase [Flammeovirga kamogawensis]
MNIYKILLSTLLFISFSYTAIAQVLPAVHKDKVWDLKEGYSDEFDDLDLQKWTNDPDDWGVWSWEPELAYVDNGTLKIKMIQETHRRNTTYGQNEELYYKSGIIRNAQPMTYGYFEAKIKGCDRFPGASPAFWMYSINSPDPTEDGQAKYAEIDVVELTQREWSSETKDWEGPEAIDMNLHAIAREEGQLIQVRPHSSKEIAQNKWYADFDPRDEYHTYGVLNRVDSIFWYVDGVERGRKENLYWHLPMYVTVSMGLRSPFVKYVNGVRFPVEEETTQEGFPTEMLCDYVRVWEAQPQVNAITENYTNKKFGKNDLLTFECQIDAGSGFVAKEKLTVRLLEKDTDGNVINELIVSDNTIIGKTEGNAEAVFDISGLTTTAGLPTGNYYALQATFETTKNGGETASLVDEIKGIEIVDEVTALDRFRENIFISPNPVENELSVKGINGQYELYIYDVIGKIKIQTTTEMSTALNVSSLSKGLYFIKVVQNGEEYVCRFLKK